MGVTISGSASIPWFRNVNHGMEKNEIQTVIKNGDLDGFRSLITRDDISGMNVALGVAKWGNSDHVRIMIESDSEYLDLVFTSAVRYNPDICRAMIGGEYRMKRYLSLFMLGEFIKENRPDLINRMVEFTGDEFIKSPNSSIRSCVNNCIENRGYADTIRYLIKIGYPPTEGDLFQSIKSRNVTMFLVLLEGCNHNFREFHKEISGNFGIDVLDISKEELIDRLIVISIHQE